MVLNPPDGTPTYATASGNLHGADVMVFGLGGVAGGRAPTRCAGACRDERDLAGHREGFGLRAALDGERGDGADCDEPRADHDRGIYAIDELLTRAIAAVDGEHRGEHGDAEHAAELADRVVGAEA